jgi:AraC-like DNA-binding protein
MGLSTDAIRSGERLVHGCNHYCYPLMALLVFARHFMREKLALETFIKTISAESLHAHFELIRQDKYFWLMLRGYRDAPAGRCVIELYDLEWMSTLVRSALGNQWRSPAVHLQCASLPEGLAATEISTGNIRFSSTMTAIAIPEALMAAPMSRYCSLPATDAGIQLNTLAQADFATSLRLLLTGYLDEGMTMSDCADLVGMSERTLQRRLAQHETTFNELHDQTRFDRAKQLLQDRSICLSDIGYELGYANPANFTRAFRRWAGVSPRQYRQLL